MFFDAESLAMVDGGYWEISYQKRVIDASMWVNEAVSEEVVEWIEENYGFSSDSIGVCLIHCICFCCNWREK